MSCTKNRFLHRIYVKGAFFMVGIQLIAIFFACTFFLIVSGLIIINSEGSCGYLPRVFIILPVNEKTSDIEFIVRSYIYAVSEQYPESAIMLCDNGADSDTIRVFEKLMDGFCRYCIIKQEDNEENICKILNDMI